MAKRKTLAKKGRKNRQTKKQNRSIKKGGAPFDVSMFDPILDNQGKPVEQLKYLYRSEIDGEFFWFKFVKKDDKFIEIIPELPSTYINKKLQDIIATFEKGSAEGSIKIDIDVGNISYMRRNRIYYTKQFFQNLKKCGRDAEIFDDCSIRNSKNEDIIIVLEGFLERAAIFRLQLVKSRNSNQDPRGEEALNKSYEIAKKKFEEIKNIIAENSVSNKSMTDYLKIHKEKSYLFQKNFGMILLEYGKLNPSFVATQSSITDSFKPKVSPLTTQRHRGQRPEATRVSTTRGSVRDGQDDDGDESPSDSDSGSE